LLRTASSLALLCATAFAVAGCSGASDFTQADTYRTMVSNAGNMFATPDWVKNNRVKAKIELGPSGPVGPEELVSADGSCPPAVATAPAAAPDALSQAAASPPAAAPAATGNVGSVAGDLASASKPAATTGAAPPPERLEPEGGAGPAPLPMPGMRGGVALGMSECQVVRRAGAPTNVSIGAGAGGDRTVVITYLEGTSPGIYHFQSGRLKEVDAAPVPDKPKAKKKPATKKKKTVKQKSARQDYDRAYVQ
jgi:hypothetical protein